MNEGIDLKRLETEVGSISNKPNTMGCYEENGVWNRYYVGERQDFNIAQKGSEGEMFDILWILTEARNNDLKKGYY